MSPRVLFLTHVPPLPAVSGERIRASRLMRGLAERGWRVSLFSVDPHGLVDERAQKQLAELCESVIIEPLRMLRPRQALRVLCDAAVRRPFQLRYFYDSSAADHLRKHLASTSYDVVQVCQLYMHGYVPADLSPPVVFDSINVEAHRVARMVSTAPASPRGVVARAQVGPIRRLERDVAENAALVLAVSLEDARYFEEVMGARVALIPNGVDLTKWLGPVSLTSEPSILLMGNLSYSANVDAVTYFVDEIAPYISRPDTRVTVLGAKPPRAVRASARSSPLPVDVTGYVESVRPYLERTRVLAVPLRYGGGTRLKILEALAAGIPVVSTSIGCEGLGLVPGREVLVADDPRGFAACVERLLDDDDLCARLAYAGRETVEQRYDWRAIEARLDEALRHVVKASYRGSA